MKTKQMMSWLVMALMISNFFLCPANLAFAQSAGASSVSANVKPVSINKADAEELQAVKGIGPSLAERIIEYRESNGGFKSLEQLKEVRGIGDAKFEKLKGQITL